MVSNTWYVDFVDFVDFVDYVDYVDYRPIIFQLSGIQVWQPT